MKFDGGEKKNHHRPRSSGIVALSMEQRVVAGYTHFHTQVQGRRSNIQHTKFIQIKRKIRSSQQRENEQIKRNESGVAWTNGGKMRKAIIIIMLR